MSATLLDGRALARRIEDSIRAEVDTLRTVVGRPPRLVVMLVGDLAASASYVKSKAAAAARVGLDAEVEDTATASLRFASGALGQVETQWTATGWEMSFAVYGTRGALEYSDRSGRPILRHLYRMPGNDSWGDVSEETWSDPAGSDHTRAVAAFLAAVRGEQPTLCSGEDGLAAVAIALACYRSFASGALEPVG